MYDHLIKRNNCYRVDAKYENLITSGAASKVSIYIQIYFPFIQ